MRLQLSSISVVRQSPLVPNRWDGVAIGLVLAAIVLVAHAGRGMSVPFQMGQTIELSLDPSNLPEYALRSVARMLLGLAASTVFSLIYAALAAKSRRAGQVLIPLLDVLQSVPVLGYISFTVTAFIALFPGSLMGAEMACIFAIFTSQAWNMTFSLYQSLRTVPRDLAEASRMFRLGPWATFWRLELPFAMPGLIWNAMMSMSGAWFFVVASEAITVGDNKVVLPGVGAYVAMAIDQKNLGAVGWALLAMLVVILLYDQFLFRPMVAWAEKFRFEQTAGFQVPESWLLDVMRRTSSLQTALAPVGRLMRAIVRLGAGYSPPVQAEKRTRGAALAVDVIWYAGLAALAVYAGWSAVDLLRESLTWADVGTAAWLGLLTLVRVALLIALATLVWVPVGVLIGLRPAWSQRVQPLVQFLAAFPANLMFPVAVVLLVKYALNPDYWLAPLMILGTQWYILFNVIAGASAFPSDMKEAARSFRVGGWLWWRKVILPGIFPYFLTGAITASGGAWNASIVAELVSWGDQTLTAHGLGAYIAKATSDGDFARIALGCGIMSLYVVISNRLVWRPLYTLSERRLRLD